MQDTDDASWAVAELGAVALGDKRRTARLVDLATQLAQRPSDSFPAACATPAQLKAAYRFFANPEVTAQALLQGHVQATTARLAAVPLVLAVQDTTVLNYTHHPATTGLGPLNTTQQQGLFVHSTLALLPERLPLGLLAQDVWVRDAATVGKRTTRKTRPIADKESQKWLHSLAAVGAARQRCPTTHFVSVGDREADVYDLFVQPRPPGVDLLVQASWDRALEDPAGEHLRAAVAAAAVAGTSTVLLPPRGGQPARQAVLTVRFRAVTLQPPRHRAAERLPAVPVWAVWAVEERPPAGTEPLDWLLLTTVAVQTVEEAQARLDWYACRWGIEVWHKVLKSGCRLEARQLESADRLRRCLTLFSIIAWRILWATMLARAAPAAPCTVLLEDAEWQALFCAIHHTRTPPAEPPTLRQAVRWIAQLGGFLGRTGDGEPGVTVLWRGFQHLADLTTMYRIMRGDPVPRPRALYPAPNVGKD